MKPHIEKAQKIALDQLEKDIQDQINKPIEYKVVKALITDIDLTVGVPASDKKFISIGDMKLNGEIEAHFHLFKKHGYVIIGISNQAEVAHGFKKAEDVRLEFDKIRSLFQNYPIDVIYYCMMDGNGKVFPYNYRSLSRKPDIGMLALAEERFYEQGIIIDWDRSLFIGDMKDDSDCAKNAEIEFQHIDYFLSNPERYLIKSIS